MGPHIWLDPSGSQFLLVIAHSAEAGDAAEAAIRVQRLMCWGSHFGARGRYYVTHVKLCLNWAVLPPAKEEAGRGRSGDDFLKRKPCTRCCHSHNWPVSVNHLCVSENVTSLQSPFFCSPFVSSSCSIPKVVTLVHESSSSYLLSYSHVRDLATYQPDYHGWIWHLSSRDATSLSFLLHHFCDFKRFKDILQSFQLFRYHEAAMRRLWT